MIVFARAPAVIFREPFKLEFVLIAPLSVILLPDTKDKVSELGKVTAFKTMFPEAPVVKVTVLAPIDKAPLYV